MYYTSRLGVGRARATRDPGSRNSGTPLVYSCVSKLGDSRDSGNSRETRGTLEKLLETLEKLGELSGNSGTLLFSPAQVMSLPSCLGRFASRGLASSSSSAVSISSIVITLIIISSSSSSSCSMLFY